MEPELSYFYEAPDSGNIYVVYDVKNLPAVLNVAYSEKHIDMTALKDYMWGDPMEEELDKALNEDAALQRLSLAYEDLQSFPKIILERVADSLKILDVSHNNINPDSGNIYVVYDVKNLPAVLNVAYSEKHIDMTALKDYMWGDPMEEELDKALNEDAALQRLSLAYEDLQSFPKIILERVADSLKILDVSHNNIKDFSFLSKMTKLSSFICDHNHIHSDVELPHMPKLELFWMNHCNLRELLPFCKTLQNSFPNLKYLSLMGNRAVPSLLRGDKIYDCEQYRIFVISLFPRLVHLDESVVTPQEREEANETKEKSLINKYLPVADSYLKKTSRKLEGMFLNATSELRINNIV